MTDIESIQYLKIARNHILRKLGKTTLCEAIDNGITAIKVVEKIKKFRECNNYPEYFEDDVFELLDETYGKE